jgi:general secretion pathway protein G
MSPARCGRRGFTIIELVVVLAIIALLAGGATVGLMATLGRAKVSTTKTDMQTVGQAITAYNVDKGTPPPALQDLLSDQYVEKPSALEDAWGRPLQYRVNVEYQGAQVPWLLISMGENGTYEGPGVGDDIHLAPGFDIQ